MIGIAEPIDFGAVGIRQVLQNVRMIVTTVIGSVPLDRDFGIDATFVDMPINIAPSKLTAEIIGAIRRYEPRALVKQVRFEGDGMTGKLIPIIRLEADI